MPAGAKHLGFREDTTEEGIRTRAMVGILSVTGAGEVGLRGTFAFFCDQGHKNEELKRASNVLSNVENTEKLFRWRRINNTRVTHRVYYLGEKIHYSP